MDFAKLLDELGYADSPHFLRKGSAELRTAPEFGHVFRKATAKPCHLEGVYTLKRNPQSKTEPPVPVVYVCRADSEEAAHNVHRLVWNQDVVPFLLLHSPRGFRLYSGFRCQPQKEGLERGVLKGLTQFNAITALTELTESFHADSIDCGKLWRVWGKEVTPETRVDTKLLGNLQELDKWLRDSGGLTKEISHALIGKYVYLHYLRDRNILSKDRLAEWRLDESTIFGRTATRKGLLTVTERLDDWLNGSVFPLKLRGPSAPDDELIQSVAGIFAGEEIVGISDRQLCFDFGLYNFSYIPIETLSVIYEQFLHLPIEGGGKTKGEDAAAYYTPIPVVNFMLSEMDEKVPLKRGMKVFDPACGSGAFLVQSYRRLIEREYPDTKKNPTPHQLRDLLEEHIFGVDYDRDACRVTELSLILTLLDYVDPPDLLPMSPTPSESDFKLPTLSESNIFESNFFRPIKAAKAMLAKTKFDWIVGNPPWKDLDPAKLIPQDEPVWKWMSAAKNKKSRPCGDNEVAQAFAWRVPEFLTDNGAAVLLLPAMTLFEDLSRKFRASFFSSQRVTAVANFSNLAEVLFAGDSKVRPRVAAAAVFFGPRSLAESDRDDAHVTVFSPLVANQEITRPDKVGERRTTWSLQVLASEIRDVPLSQLLSGDGLSWKIAAWGTPSDERLLRRLLSIGVCLKDLESENVLEVAEGPALVSDHVTTGKNKTTRLPEVVGKPVLNMKAVARLRHLFAFPDSALEKNEKFYGHDRRGFRGVAVCRPPHIVVSETRFFSVFSNSYVIVPPRQIGIASTTKNEELLKSLSLFLSSEFAYYHQFFLSTCIGVKRDIATLRSLRSIPIPIASYSREQLQPWINLHGRLVKTTPVDVREARKTESLTKQRELPYDHDGEDLKALLNELNDLVYDALGLDDRERALVHDLVNVRRHLIDGNIGLPAVRLPQPDEMKAYARRLKRDLDDFIDDELDQRFQVGVVYDKASVSGMVQIDLIADKAAARDIIVVAADKPTAKQLEKTRQRLRKQQSQWVYFDRNLRIYEGTKTFVFKPLQRFHWTESQAMQDASEIIAETLQLGDESP